MASSDALFFSSISVGWIAKLAPFTVTVTRPSTRWLNFGRFFTFNFPFEARVLCSHLLGIELDHSHGGRPDHARPDHRADRTEPVATFAVAVTATEPWATPGRPRGQRPGYCARRCRAPLCHVQSHADLASYSSASNLPWALYAFRGRALSTCLRCNGNSALGGSGAVEVRGSGGLRRPGDVGPSGQAVGHLAAIVIGGEPMAAGPKRGEITLNTARNRWAAPGARKRFMARSRCRVGWWEFCARLRYLDWRCSTDGITARCATG